MSSTTPTIPPHYLANTAAVFSAFITVNGIYGTLQPAQVLKMLSFPNASSPADQNLVEGLVRMFASTRTVVGLSSLAMWWTGDYKALALANVAGTLMALTDGWVTKRLLGKGEWGHWWAAPVGLSIGVGLLRLV